MVWPGKLSKINYSPKMLTEVNTEQQTPESPAAGQATGSSAHLRLDKL